MAKFADIPPFVRSASYGVDVGLDYLPKQYATYVKEYGLDVCPDFQRNYVWTESQKIRFIEYMLRGGISGVDIYMNDPDWNRLKERPSPGFVLVDGKQRLDAALGFINNEFPAFGHFRREYTDRLRITHCNFRFHVNDLQTREEVLQWYLDLNSGGTVHTAEELDKVRELLVGKVPYVRPSHEEIVANARLDREVIVMAMEEERAFQERVRAEAAASQARDIAKKVKTRRQR